MKNIMNNICNYDIDKYMLENGIDLKACDFEEDGNIKTMIPRRRHTTTEKNKADVKWRVNFTGKKHHKDRTREDYKMAKLENEWKRDYRSYSRGGYDRNGIIQNRRYNKAVDDAMNDIFDNDELEHYIHEYFRLVEAREYYQNLVNRLQKECDIIRWMYSNFSVKVESEANNNDFIYRPTVDIDSYAFDALERAEADLAEVESELDWVRKSGATPSLLNEDAFEWWDDEDDDEGWYDDEDAFEYHRYWDPEINDHVIKKFRKGVR